jgi:hypothetical protein
MLFSQFVILENIVDIALHRVYSSPCVSCPRYEETPMARMLIFDGDECLWNLLSPLRKGHSRFWTV